MSTVNNTARVLPVVVLAVLSLVVPQPAPVRAGDSDREKWLRPQQWQRDIAQPCISLGEDGAFDSEHVHGPCVFYEKGRYVMLYTGASEPVYERVMQMGIAFSEDGKTFERYAGNPVLSLEGRQITTPMVLRRPDGSVLREDGRLRLWFTATGRGEDRESTFLMETSSRDGLTWSPPRKLDLPFAYAPTIIRDGDLYRMWFTDARKDPWPIRYASSRDGTHWQVHPEPVLKVDQSWERKRLFYPTVLKQDGQYLMWYGSYKSRRKGEAATTALGFAVSADGLSWEKNPHNPVFGPDPERSWESHYTTCQTVLPLPDGSWRIWYATRPEPPFDHKYYAIGTARWEEPKAPRDMSSSGKDAARQHGQTIKVAGIMNPSVAEVETAMKKAAVFYREHFARDGGYPQTRPPNPEKSKEKQSRVKLEGASPIGLAYLKAYLASGDASYLDVPREAAHALAWAQLASGGWHHKMNNDPQRARTYYYRRDVEAGDTDKGDRTNHTVFDDDLSQSAARLLLLYDHATGFQDTEVHHASRYALSGFVKLQYSSGGWPMWVQRSRQVPAIHARYPESWSRTHPKEFYPPYYTINDEAIPGVIDALLLGHVVYDDLDCLASARRGGDFLILAQMPEPQPAWCQQYTMKMVPAWARKFEPPSIVSYESTAVIETLMKLYVVTGDEKYRAPIPPALNWFERSRLPDGRFARFYELETNTPLYFNTDYELVYTDDDLPTHYRFKWEIDTDGLRQRYQKLDAARSAYRAADSEEKRLKLLLDWPSPKATPERVRELIGALDEQDRWTHERYAPGRIFVQNLNLLSSYIERHK